MLQIKTLPDSENYTAPDGSAIRLLLETEKGGCCHCTLPAGKTSKAVTHKTVEEIWYVLSGQGEMWQNEQSELIPLFPTQAVTIPTGNHFQFRNTGSDNLSLLIVTMPPWPGEQEAVAVRGYWE